MNVGNILIVDIVKCNKTCGGGHGEGGEVGCTALVLHSFEIWLKLKSVGGTQNNSLFPPGISQVKIQKPVMQM